MDSISEFAGENHGLQSQDMGNQKTAFSDHQMNGFKYENGGHKSDCYIVDLENFSNGVDKEHNIHSSTTTNSRITLQRSLSRKVPQRGAERKLNDRDNLGTSSSPRGMVNVSSMGTMLLIYFTLSMSKANDTEGVIDWQQ
ncbi:HAUS augmin-like complex subunit 8 [Bienertia sinuspersici]